MSLEKKSTHVRMDEEIHDQLRILSEATNKDIAELAAELLTKAVVGEFHVFRLAAERMHRLGFGGTRGDSAKPAGKSARPS